MTVEAKRLLGATLAAAVAAAVILVTIVLPAEYGIDPLRTGSALGLTALADSRVRVLASQPSGLKRDSIEFVLGPYEMVEYKYRLAERATVLFSWAATGDVIYDFHSEPDGAPDGYAQSFEKGRSAYGNGSYAAPFSGIHGWYWENPGATLVRITLTSAGFYTEAIEFHAGGQRSYAVSDIRAK
jgi:hypothetical protein